MVNACVYAWAFSLLGLQVFGDTSKPTGMPTLLSCVPYQGGSIAKTTEYGRIFLFHSIRLYCRRYRRRVARHPQLKASIPTPSQQKIQPRRFNHTGTIILYSSREPQAWNSSPTLCRTKQQGYFL